MNYKSGELTLEKLENAIEEFYHGKNTELTIEELKAKVLPGYMYTMGGDNRLGTGQGGVLMYIDACAAKGLPAFLIAENITVHIPEKHQIFKLSDITVTKTDDNH